MSGVRPAGAVACSSVEEMSATPVSGVPVPALASESVQDESKPVPVTTTLVVELAEPASGAIEVIVTGT